MAFPYRKSPRKWYPSSTTDDSDEYTMATTATTTGWPDSMSSLWDQRPSSQPSSDGPPSLPRPGDPLSTTSSVYASTTTDLVNNQTGSAYTQPLPTSSGAYSSSMGPNPQGDGHKSSYWGGMASGIMLAIIVIGFGMLLMCLRRRRRRRRQEYLKRENKGSEENGIPAPSSTPHSVTLATPLRPAVIAPRNASHQQDQPIILSSIDPSRNNTYFTGLDTSDVMSVTSSGTRTTNMEEPPPPYRPRSVATALSRDSSVRHPPQLNAAASSAKEDSRPPIRSPFADPSDDGRLSDISEPSGGPSRRREEDEISAVSDLSYQHGGSADGSSGRR